MILNPAQEGGNPLSQAPSTPVLVASTGTAQGHIVLVSIAVLLGAAFAFQGIADSGQQAHNVVLALLVGVVILLTMRYAIAGRLGWLTQYPAVPGG